MDIRGFAGTIPAVSVGACALHAGEFVEHVPAATRERARRQRDARDVDVGAFFRRRRVSVDAVVGIVGAIKVYNAWSHGDQQTNKLAASWFGACIFLVVVATCLKSFFNVT